MTHMLDLTFGERQTLAEHPDAVKAATAFATPDCPNVQAAIPLAAGAGALKVGVGGESP